MESVLLKANLVNLSTGQYWLNFDRQKGMLDREGHGHKAVLYKSHFPATKAFTKTFLLERHHCIHRLINHVYTKEAQSHSYHCPMTLCICEPLGTQSPKPFPSTFLPDIFFFFFFSKFGLSIKIWKLVSMRPPPRTRHGNFGF